MPEYTKTAVENGIAVVAIDNPPANVLSRPVFEEIGAAIEGYLKDKEVRGIVLTGEGANFAAGADIKEIAKITDAAEGERMALEAHKLGNKIASADLPIIAAINGYCLGGGCELILACPLRVASDKARIGQPEIKIGIIPGMGGTQRLPRIVGPAKALEILLTGEMVSAQEAYRIGLVNLLVPEAQLRRQAVGLASRIGKMSKVAIAKTLKLVREGIQMPLEQALPFEAKLFGEMMPTEDKKIGVTAFVGKNPNPKFVDK